MSRQMVQPVAAVVIVEGKRDRERLLPLLARSVKVVCTYGIPTSERLADIVQDVGDASVYIFVDHDDAGRRIRGRLAEEFPDATHLHTRREYGGVEKTPADYLRTLLLRHDLCDALHGPKC
jgi:toprim domain protein